MLLSINGGFCVLFHFHSRYWGMYLYYGDFFACNFTIPFCIIREYIYMYVSMDLSILRQPVHHEALATLDCGYLSELTSSCFNRETCELISLAT